MTARMLGLHTPKNAPALMLGPALTGAVPAHPPAADHFSRIDDWGLYGNDRYGDCGPVSVANLVKLITLYLGGTEISVFEYDVWDLYRRSGNPGFDPAFPGGPGDQGVDMQTMLEALTKGGIGGGIGGGHRPVAFAKINHLDPDEVKAAISIFGGVLLGVVLREAQQAQTDERLWDYADSPIWGGHAVLAGRYSNVENIPSPDPFTVARGIRVINRTGVITWAEVVDATDTFLNTQLQEAWVVIMPEHLGTTAFQQGVDLGALARAYTALTGRPFPAPFPPVPAPVPAPPAPTPPPGVDQADLALANALVHWAAENHHGENRAAAQSFLRWRKAKGL
jgi:hypothetical protein